MKKLICCLVFLYNFSNAQISITINQIPFYYTPLTDTIFAAGTFNGWNPRDLNHRLVQQSNGSYTLTLPNGIGNTELKFTRGSWLKEETQLNGNQLANRVVQNNQSYTFSIQNWNDMLGWHTAVGNTHIIDQEFYIPQLNRYRRVWIYLPQNYYISSQNYPVVYAHDGQNLFDEVYTAFGTEWGLDENLKNLEDTFGLNIIAVGIDNGGAERINEYSPYLNNQYGGGSGENYINFISNTLKPYIDANFRTISNRENTAIIGSSMGGLISFYAALEKENIFSKSGIFSPSFWFSDSIFSYTQNHSFNNFSKYYFVCGTNESSGMVPDINNIVNTMNSNTGFNGSINTAFRLDGQHSEWFWRRELRNCLLWLFQDIVTNNKSENIIQNTLFDVNETLLKASSNCLLNIIDMNGKIVLEKQLVKGEQYQITQKGTYILKAVSNQKIQTKKIIN
jgi:predicted alpha/beta superfamily hydrolase